MVSEECELVTLMSVVRGRFELTTAYLYFFDSRQGDETEIIVFVKMKVGKLSNNGFFAVDRENKNAFVFKNYTGFLTKNYKLFSCSAKTI